MISLSFISIDIHYALQILHSKSLFWFLATSVFFTIQTCVRYKVNLTPYAAYRIKCVSNSLDQTVELKSKHHPTRVGRWLLILL